MTVFQLNLHCPDLHTMEDAEIVRETLFAAPGTSDVDVDWKAGLVSVATANQDGGKDAVMRLINAGFRPAETL